MVRPEEAAAFVQSAAPRILDGRGRRAGGPGHGRGAMAEMVIGGRHAIGKRALHGGLLGPALGGVYVGHGRIEATARAAVRLRAAGVPTPDVIAAGWRRVAGPLCALALFTEAIPGSSVHEQLLANPRQAARRRVILRAAGETVRRMHDAGFLHADLNLANLLVEAGAGGTRVHIVDLDRGRFMVGLGPREALGNLRRLIRSWEKFIGSHVRGDIRDLAAFLRGYSADPAERRRLAAALVRHRSRLWARRIVWRWRV